MLMYKKLLCITMLLSRRGMAEKHAVTGDPRELMCV
jgi:hypothetical protein